MVASRLGAAAGGPSRRERPRSRRGTPRMAVLILVMLLLPTGAGGLLRRVLGPLTSRLYTRS